MKNTHTRLLAPAAGLLLLAGQASGAVITWAPSVNLFAGGDNTNFVSQNGAFVVGFNGGTTAATQIVGDSTFTATDAAALTTGVTAGGVTVTTNIINDAGPTTFGSGQFTDATVGAMINSAVWSGTLLTMSGLIINQPYEMQILLNDARGGTGAGTRDTNWEVGFNDGNGGTTIAGLADLNNRPFNTAADPNLEGDYIIGTFLADATTQSFDFAATRGNNPADVYTLGGPLTNVNGGQAQINAFQLRAVPEPGSAALLGLAGLALILRRRK